MLTQEQIKANVQAIIDQGGSQEAAQAYLDSLKNKQQGVYAKQYKPASQEGSVLHEIVKSVAHLPLKFISTGESLAQDAKSFYNTAKGGFKTMDFSAGDKIRREGADYGYLGKVSPIGGNFQETGDIGAMAKDVFGTALEGASWIPAGGTAKAGLTGLEVIGKVGVKEALKDVGKLALTGAKTGAVSGSLYGAGESMQNDENIVDTLLNTVKGGAIGGVSGGILNPILAASGNIVSDAISNISNKGIKQGVVDSIGNVIDNTLPQKTTNITQDVIDTNLSTDFKKGMKSYDSLLQESQKTIKPLQGASSDIQDAYMKEISSIDKPFTEIIEGGEKKLSLMPALEKVTNDIKTLAEQGTTIAKEYKGQNITSEVIDEINNLASQKTSSGVIGKTKEFQNALKKEINNFYLNDKLSLDELLNIKRNIDISNILESSTEVSAQKEARAVIKEALSNKIHEKIPEIANLDSQISQKMKFMSLFTNKDIFKVGHSGVQDIAKIVGSITGAQHGFIVGFALRDIFSKIAGLVYPGSKQFINASGKTLSQSKVALQFLVDNGVDKDLATQFLREASQNPSSSVFSGKGNRYNFNKETVTKVIEQLQNFTEQGTKNIEAQATKKIAEAKSLIKIIKGLGTDIETIKEVVNEAGKDITDTQAKALATMNKNNTSKSISSYLELLNSLNNKQSTLLDNNLTGFIDELKNNSRNKSFNKQSLDLTTSSKIDKKLLDDKADYMITSVMNPQGNEVSNNINKIKTLQFQTFLEKNNIDYIPQEGVYGGKPEISFLIDIVKPEQRKLIDEFTNKIAPQAENILIKNGKAYRYDPQTMKAYMVRLKGKSLKVPQTKDNYYSVINGQKYNLPLYTQLEKEVKNFNGVYNK